MNIDHPQVLKPVIALVPVDVIDMLRAKEFAPEMLFHEPSVFELAYPVHGDSLVADTVREGLGLSKALLRAEPLGANTARGDAKRASALGTLDRGTSVVMGFAASQRSESGFFDSRDARQPEATARAVPCGEFPVGRNVKRGAASEA